MMAYFTANQALRLAYSLTSRTACWVPVCREPQEQVILNALAGGDSMVVMATGGGKSICYQVPPLITGVFGACRSS